MTAAAKGWLSLNFPLNFPNFPLNLSMGQCLSAANEAKYGKYGDSYRIPKQR